MRSSSTQIPFLLSAVIAISIYSVTRGPNFYGPTPVVSNQQAVEVIEGISAELVTTVIKTVKIQP